MLHQTLQPRTLRGACMDKVDKMDEVVQLDKVAAGSEWIIVAQVSMDRNGVATI